MKKVLLILTIIIFYLVSFGGIANSSTYRIVVNKSYKLLFLYEGNTISQVFPVCIGEHTTDNETPTGIYTIVNKTFDPLWYFEGKVYQPYKIDKNNGLGMVWMGWNLPSYGLHGTNEPFSIGFANSHGCVRMENKDALYIAKTVPIGTQIEIREGSQNELSVHLEAINVLYAINTVLNGTK
ncbi:MULTISPECIES: L,D-transpeptidase [Caldisericum]|jgi:lipoprotein-anchoring transpeptidase ErfK/SrfK|uniref:L,D-transpeptidase n=1 Tax=Caldisericum TaxID=693074 RepID=UPI003C73E63C